MCRGCHDPPCSRWQGGAGLLLFPEGPSRDVALFCGQGLLLGLLLLGGWGLGSCGAASPSLGGCGSGDWSRAASPPRVVPSAPARCQGRGTQVLWCSARTSAPAPIHAQAAPAPLLECTVGHLPAPPRLQGRGAELGGSPLPAASISSSLLQEHSRLLSPHCL